MPSWYSKEVGRLQRIAISRLFYHHPKFAILGESTTYVGKQFRPKLYCTVAISDA